MIRFGGRLLGCLGVFCLFFAVAVFGAGEEKKPAGITVGKPAPDFDLPKLAIGRDADGEPIGKISEEKIRLSSFFGKKPVCVIMSSYTWPPFTARAAELERLYASYRNQVEFLIVYIREAHPEMLKRDHKTGVEGRPDNFDERIILATECLLEFEFTIPTIIDYMDGKVDAAYSAKPVRTTITDLDGNVAYYAGRGPFDFKIWKIERAIKKIIAGGGYMPAVPAVEWGEAVDGLRCGLSIDPADAAVGDDVTVKIVLENTGDVECDVHYRGVGILEDVTIRNEAGGELGLEAVLDNSPRAKRYRERDIGWKEIGPGKSRTFEIQAKVVGESEGGKFTAEFSFAVNEETLANIDGDLPDAVWVGKIGSGKFGLDVIGEREETCADCHSKEDYHHKVDRDCAMCHVGEMGTDDFDVKKDACVTCHKREGKFGRRKIFGADGDFDKASMHISGMITEATCRECHDMGAHGDGKVKLVGGDSRVEFCVTCHEKDGFDESAHGAKLGGNACGHCHNSHGSDNVALLKKPLAFSGKGEGSVSENYALCWGCHDEKKVMGGENAFGELHGKHVLKKQVSCVACHDVHGGGDEGEPGLIDLAYGVEKGSGAKVAETRGASGSFGVEADSGKGYCYVDCHEKHQPKRYSRGGKGGTLLKSKHE